MTTIQLHPRSLLVSLALGGVVLFSMAQSAAPTYATVRMQYMPHPRDMVQIEEGTPYTVPAGKLFVLTGLGSKYGMGGFVTLLVDGVDEPTANSTVSSSATATSVAHVTLGLAGQPGSVIDLVGGVSYPDDGRAWGYPADECELFTRSDRRAVRRATGGL